MKKISILTLKKINYYLIFMLTSVLVITSSCKKDISKNISFGTKENLLDEAKNFFKQEILTQNLYVPNDQNYRHTIEKYPDWEKAGIKQISIGDALIVPLKYNKMTFFKNQNSKTELALEKTSYLMFSRVVMEKCRLNG